MNAELFITLTAMREELQSSRLEVGLAPPPEPRHEGHMIRVVLERNCLWYRQLCARFSSSRKGTRTRTAIKRRETLRALNSLLAGTPAAGIYAHRIMDAARSYWKRNARELRERLASDMEVAA